MLEFSKESEKEAMRTERVRQPRRVDYSSDPNVVPCSHEEMFELAQQEIAEHSAIASENARNLREWSDEQHRIAREARG